MKKITAMNLETKTNIYTRKIDMTMSSDCIKTEFCKVFVKFCNFYLYKNIHIFTNLIRQT